jgi:transcriptional adapter 2-alpha
MDLEWENDAEVVLADMEFSSSDSPQDRELKLQIIEIYNSKLDERERRKNFLLSRSLLNYRQNQQADLKMPRDERDLVRRLRLFERLHTPEEHEQFVADILKAKRLRKEIAKLQMYRRMGITTLEEAEKFELDKNRREYHKMAQLQKEAASESATETSSSALWKQYKSNDRTARRSFGRSDSGPSEPGASQSTITEESKMSEASEKNVVASSLPPDVQVSSSEVPVESRFSDGADDFDITQAPSYGLLSRKEVDLCRRLRLLPQQYLDVKATIIYESMNQGLLDNESAGSSRRAIVKIDSKRKGDVVEFMVRAGWVSPKLSMRT